MQGGNLVMGFRQWEKEFDRHVKKGEKGIKIFAPAPYKVKKLVDKIDPETRKPMLDREGKAIKEEKEITVQMCIRDRPLCVNLYPFRAA